MAELAAALESQDTDQEGGIIRCVCGLAEDDGYTIQCELCEVWQHILCVIIDPKNEPETYLCEECSPRWIDAEGARERQLRRRQAEQDLARDTLEDQDSVKATARAFALGEHTLDFVDDVFEPPQPRKRSVSAYSITNTSGQQNFDLPPAKKKRKSRGNPVSYEPSTPPFEHSLAQYTHSRKSTVVQVPVDDIDQQESWAYEYTEVDHNLWPDPQAIEHVRLALESWFAYEGQPYRISAQKVKTQSSSPTSPYTLQWSRHPIPEGETGYYASYKDVEDVGLCAPLGPVVLPDKNISDSHITVKNVPSTSFSLAPPLSTPFLPSNTCTAPTSACPYPRPVSQAVYASMALAPGDLITTFAGQVLSRNTYKANKTSQYDLLGAPKPGVRALPMPWSVMVDARHFGNFGRFARR